MKANYKRLLLFLPVLVLTLLLNPASAQNVGIGTATPTEKLDVIGNLKFTGALMPNNNAGTTGRILMSAGANTPPTWGPPLLNTAATTNIGKFYVNGVTIAPGTTTLTVADPNCVPASCIVMSFAGLLPGTAAQNSNIRIINVQTGTGQFVVQLSNTTAGPSITYTGVSLAYIAFY